MGILGQLQYYCHKRGSKRTMIASISKLVTRNIRVAKSQPGDYAVYCVLHILIISTLIYGVYTIPEVCVNSSWMILILAYAAAVWIFVAIIAHLHLMRIRNSSIANRLLIRPQSEETETEKRLASLGEGYRGNKTDAVTNEMRVLAEQFTSTPFNSETAWHICGTCETFVPPRTWHCGICKTCILRRDHHCIFAMSCVGEDNQSNFLGFLLYVAMGTGYATVIGCIHMVIIQGSPWWLWLLKSLVAFYTMFFDLSLYNLLLSINLTGCMATTGMFIFYYILALRGQTSADNSKGITRPSVGKSRYSCANLENFLGPHPVLRILWPFYPVVRKSYDCTLQKENVSAKDFDVDDVSPVTGREAFFSC